MACSQEWPTILGQWNDHAAAGPFRAREGLSEGDEGPDGPTPAAGGRPGPDSGAGSPGEIWTIRPDNYQARGTHGQSHFGRYGDFGFGLRDGFAMATGSRLVPRGKEQRLAGIRIGPFVPFRSSVRTCELHTP